MSNSYVSLVEVFQAELMQGVHEGDSYLAAIEKIDANYERLDSGIAASRNFFVANLAGSADVAVYSSNDRYKGDESKAQRDVINFNEISAKRTALGYAYTQVIESIEEISFQIPPIPERPELSKIKLLLERVAGGVMLVCLLGLALWALGFLRDVIFWDFDGYSVAESVKGFFEGILWVCIWGSILGVLATCAEILEAREEYKKQLFIREESIKRAESMSKMHKEKKEFDTIIRKYQNG